MNNPIAIIDKKVDWHEYDVLGFTLEELKQGKYKWWSTFVKTYERVYVEIYDNCVEIMMTNKNGEKTQLKQLSFNHYKAKMTAGKDILMLISHPDLGRIYFVVNTSDIVKGTWVDVIKAGKPKAKPTADKPFAHCKW